MRSCLLFLSVFPLCFQAHATAVYFDDLPGQSCNNQNIATCGPSLTNQYAAQGIIFNNPVAGDPSNQGVDVVDNLLTSFIPNATSPNVLFVYQGGGIQQPAFAPFQLLFTTPVTSIGFDYGSSADAFLELDAYDSNNKLLKTVDFVGNSAPIGLAGSASIQSSTPIARVDLAYHPNSDFSRTFSFSIDNLQFSPVPEPSTLALLGIGFLGLGLIRRRR